MGSCESNNIKKNKKLLKSEGFKEYLSLIDKKNEELKNAGKSLCRIVTKNEEVVGFFIELFKKDKNFLCLMTTPKVISNALKEKANNIEVYYIDIDKEKKICLDLKKRYIKDFRDNNINATVIEITPEDCIPRENFVLPDFNYVYNSKNLYGEDISILNYSLSPWYDNYRIKNVNKYEFSFDNDYKIYSEGSPIFLRKNFKVIGIYKPENYKSEKCVDLIGPIVDYFKKLYLDDIIFDKSNYADKLRFSFSPILIETSIYVKFISVDKKICDSFSASSSTLFFGVVSQYYEKYPDYKSRNCVFIYHGRIMDHNLSLEENKYKSEEPIMVVFEE